MSLQDFQNQLRSPDGSLSQSNRILALELTIQQDQTAAPEEELVAQTPWESDIDGAAHSLTNVSKIGVSTGTPAYPVDVVGGVNCSDAFTVNGTPMASVTGLSPTGNNWVLGTIYQNAFKLPMFLTTTWDLEGNGDSVRVDVGATSPPTTNAGSLTDSASEGIRMQLFVIILPGWYYRFTATSGAPVLVNSMVWF
jgi:hypothetical protein